MKPKILYLLPYFNLAGTEIHVVELIKELRKEYEILVVSPRGKGFVLLEENKIPYKEIPFLSFFNFQKYKKILKLTIEDFNPNLIHIHGAHELVYISKKISPNIPVLFTCHGYATSFPSIDYFLSAFINNKWGDRVICVSDYGRRFLRKMGLSENKLVLIHNGISETSEKWDLPLRIDGFIIGTVARLSKSKGINYLISAFSIVEKDYKDIKLVLIGDGEERKNLEKLAEKLKVRDKVYFLGSLPHAKYYIKNFKIFVLPSLSEFLSLSLLEALSLKVPVIATRVGGTFEIIEDGVNGILVPPRDSKSLALAIEKLIKDDNLREKLAEKGYERFCKEFTLESMIEKTKNIYKYFLNSSR
ncbi:MAG: glycosyltransferase family 4 protein [Dictyoglomaceae bacterium]|nr:glycosyltransferase family 4 protein [Dictyoglomaceae bacterium]